jgi:hypothetical protein
MLALSLSTSIEAVTSSDPVRIGIMMYMCEILSDSINALSIQDESRQISSSICRAIRLVDHEDDFETQLQFLTDCRYSI